VVLGGPHFSASGGDEREPKSSRLGKGKRSVIRLAPASPGLFINFNTGDSRYSDTDTRDSGLGTILKPKRLVPLKLCPL
jgi:hypothetical protein